MSQIEAVIFDWGGVLIDDPAPGLVAFCARALGVSESDFRHTHERFIGPFHTGRWPESTFWQHVCQALDRPLPETVSLWSDAFKAIHSPRPAVLDLVRRIAGLGVKVALLSNTEPPVARLFPQFGYDVFPVKGFSCEVGYAKPDPRIYHTIIERLGCAPGQAVFVDDRLPFVQGASNCGLKGILYTDLDLLVRALTDLGVLDDRRDRASLA